MSNLKMKNMIILKNLPSNLIEEAIVIVKSTKKAKHLEKVDYKTSSKNTKYNINSKIEKEENTYIIKEAENVILDYIKNVENKTKINVEESINIKRKYKNTKKYLMVTISIIIIQLAIIIF